MMMEDRRAGYLGSCMVCEACVAGTLGLAGAAISHCGQLHGISPTEVRQPTQTLRKVISDGSLMI